MTDIKKAIEEARTRLCCERFNLAGKIKYGDIYEQGIEAGANFILSKWQESERWRKVEEELPEITPDEPYFINVKTDDNNIETLCIEEGTNCIDKLYRHYKEWKPIH